MTIHRQINIKYGEARNRSKANLTYPFYHIHRISTREKYNKLNDEKIIWHGVSSWYNTTYETYSGNITKTKYVLLGNKLFVSEYMRALRPTLGYSLSVTIREFINNIDQTGFFDFQEIKK